MSLSGIEPEVQGLLDGVGAGLRRLRRLHFTIAGRHVVSERVADAFTDLVSISYAGAVDFPTAVAGAVARAHGGPVVDAVAGADGGITRADVPSEITGIGERRAQAGGRPATNVV